MSRLADEFDPRRSCGCGFGRSSYIAVDLNPKARVALTRGGGQNAYVRPIAAIRGRIACARSYPHLGRRRERIRVTCVVSLIHLARGMRFDAFRVVHRPFVRRTRETERAILFQMNCRVVTRVEFSFVIICTFIISRDRWSEKARVSGRNSRFTWMYPM